VLNLPPGKRLALQLNLPHAQAERQLRETGGEGLTVDAYFDLVLLATGSKAEAKRRAKAYRNSLAGG
jgi:hypothetical protein